jgi:hypothetical protein
MSGNNTPPPNFAVPYTMPDSVPPPLRSIIKPIYIALQNIIAVMTRYGGVASRSPGDILTSTNDPTAILSSNVHRFYTQATETITEGAAVNLVASLGSITVRNANATTGSKPCDGFCSQVGGLVAGQIGEVILNDGVVLTLSGLVVGTRYFLDTSNGGYTASPPVAAGNLQQYLGIAITTTALRFWTGDQTQH